MSRFTECLHGDLEHIGDTGDLTIGELRALAQNLCRKVANLERQVAYMNEVEKARG